MSASAEYRVPLAAPSRGLGLFPFFVDRASLALFGDAGTLALSRFAASRLLRRRPLSPPTIASVGGELDIDSALQFDVPYRFRLGVAIPVQGRAYSG